MTQISNDNKIFRDVGGGILGVINIVIVLHF